MILVTGGTGYAGFYTAIALRQAGHQVSALTRDESKPRAKELRKYEVQIAVGDIKQPKTYRQYLEDSDVLIHAMMDFDEPQKADRQLFETLKQVGKRPNAIACLSILLAARSMVNVQNESWMKALQQTPTML